MRAHLPLIFRKFTDIISEVHHFESSDKKILQMNSAQNPDSNKAGVYYYIRAFSPLV